MTLNGTDTNSWGVWAKHLILGRGGGVKIDVFTVSLDFFFCSIRPTVWIFLFFFEILDQGIYCWVFFFKLCLSDFVYLSDGTTKIEDSG